MQSWFSLEIDGRNYRVEGEEATRKTLAWFIEERGIGSRHAYTDVKPWAGGASVIMLGTDAENRSTYRAVDSSIILLAQTAGQRYLTAEGISQAIKDDPDHPLFAALRKSTLIDCGRTGKNNAIVSLFEGYYRRDLNTIGELSEQFDGCVSRSADHQVLRQAATELFAEAQKTWKFAEANRDPRKDADAIVERRADVFGDAFSGVMADHPAEVVPLSFVDPKKRRFYRPSTVVELIKLLTQYPDSDVIAGGTDMGRRSVRGEVEWQSLISVEGVTELKTIIEEDDYWEVGSATPLSIICEKLGPEYPALEKICRRFGSRPIRNRATLGGYLASAHPSGELAPLLMALDAQVRIAYLQGERDVPLSGFFDTPGAPTVLRQGEIIKSVIFPRFTDRLLGKRGSVDRLCDAYKSAPLRAMSRAIVASGFAVEIDEDEMVRRAWIAYAGVGDKPMRARRAESELVGKPWSEKTIVSVLPVVSQEMKLADGANASAVYRQQLVITLFQKFYYQNPGPGKATLAKGAQEDFLLGGQTFMDATRSVVS